MLFVTQSGFVKYLIPSLAKGRQLFRFHFVDDRAVELLHIRF